MGYHSKFGVVSGVHVDKTRIEEEDIDRLPKGLYGYLYTPDCNTMSVVVGKVLVPMEDSSVPRNVLVPTLTYEADMQLKADLKATGLFTEEELALNYGSWFVQGGS